MDPTNNIINDINQNEKISSNPNILIYVLYHNDESYRMIGKYKNYPYLQLTYIETTKYFDNIIFKYLLENKEQWISKDYVGILAYSCENKLSMKIDDIYENIINILYYHNGCDLITFYNNGYLSNGFHGKIEQILDYVLSEFGFEYPVNYNIIPAFYSNYWITRPIWMEKYIDFALRIIDKLDDISDLYLQTLINSDGDYFTKQGPPLSSEKLMQLIGFPYYPHNPFIIERIPSLFFWRNNFIKIMNKKIFTKFEFFEYIDYDSPINFHPKIFLIDRTTDRTIDYTKSELYLHQIQQFLNKNNYQNN